MGKNSWPRMVMSTCNLSNAGILMVEVDDGNTERDAGRREH